MGIESRNPAEEAAAAEYIAKIMSAKRAKIAEAKAHGILNNPGETRSVEQIWEQAKQEVDAGVSVYQNESSSQDHLPPAESGFWKDETTSESPHGAAIDMNIKSYIDFIKKGKYDFASELKAKVEEMIKEDPPIDAPNTQGYGVHIRELISQAGKELKNQQSQEEE